MKPYSMGRFYCGKWHLLLVMILNAKDPAIGSISAANRYGDGAPPVTGVNLLQGTLRHLEGGKRGLLKFSISNNNKE
jgi:hypothetical protein